QDNRLFSHTIDLISRFLVAALDDSLQFERHVFLNPPKRMNKATVFFLATVSLVASALSRDEYTIKKIQPAVVQTPDITFQGSQHRAGRAEQWLEVEVNFESNIEFTDELTFKYYIFFAGKCLIGEVTHVNIPKGRDLFSVMYVSPRTLQR